MELSVSILSIKDKLEEKIKLLDNSNINYLHIDVEDGVFVPNKTSYFEVLKNMELTKPLDIHLMVKDVYSYIDIYSKLKPYYLTFHYEINDDKTKVIDYIKNKNIKVGLSINPSTKVKEIKSYLDKIDLVLVMGVEPGLGAQSFIKKTYKKIKQLKRLQKKHSFVIEVDGGVKDTNICKTKADIVVMGSYITKNRYYKAKIKEINEIIKSC